MDALFMPFFCWSRTQEPEKQNENQDFLRRMENISNGFHSKQQGQNNAKRDIFYA